MDKIEDLYQFAVTKHYYSLELVIEYLVNEKKVLKMSDDEEKLQYYLQDRFSKKLNEYLSEYERVRNV